MALRHKDFQITRDTVAGWVATWKAQPIPRPQTLRQYVRAQVDALNLPDPYLDVSERDDYQDDSIHLGRIIGDDLQSYG